MATGMRPFSVVTPQQQQQQQQFVGNDVLKSTHNYMPADLEGSDNGLLESDEFKMYFYKVIPCSKRCCHDWTTCPYAHPGEKAARRDPRLFNYVAQVCAEVKKSGFCDRGSLCMYAHNVFEYWLHPTKYRTQLCNDGSDCRRKQVCFFAHTLEELRVPAASAGALNAFDGSLGGIPQAATVKLKDALAQEKAKSDNITGSTSPISSPYTTYVNHQPPPPPPHMSNPPLFNQLSPQPAPLFQEVSNTTQDTMAKTQDLLQQLKLIQAFKGVNMSNEVAALSSGVPALGEDWVAGGYQGLNMQRKSRSSSSSSSYGPSISPYPSFLPSSPPSPPHFPTQQLTHYQPPIKRI